MATSKTPEGEHELPQKTSDNITQDGRPIFQSSHYDMIPVKEKRGAIRILRLHPGEPGQTEVRCELIPGTILTRKEQMQDGTEGDGLRFKPYDALSWCWGRDAQSARISILKDETSYVKYVQPNLLAALRALRHKTYARYLWVDAICIDQEHKAEKNVSIMIIQVRIRM